MLLAILTSCAWFCQLLSFIAWLQCCRYVSIAALFCRELAFQIYKEYERFSKYFEGVKIAVFFGGISIKKDQETLKNNCPHIVVGTPGRILALVREKTLDTKHLKHFVLDECDKMLDQLGELGKRRERLPFIFCPSVIFSCRYAQRCTGGF
jgi:hypothetical protein